MLFHSESTIYNAFSNKSILVIVKLLLKQRLQNQGLLLTQISN